MLARLVPLLMAAAVAVLMLALARMGEALKQLKSRIDRLEAPPVDPEPAIAHPPGFHGVRRPMLGAIIEESPSPLDGLGRWPGGRFALAAGGLALVAAIGAMVSSGPRPDPKANADLAMIRAEFDSVKKSVAAHRDSAAATVLAAAPVPAPPAVKPAAKAIPTKASPKRAPEPPVRVAAAAPSKATADRGVRGAKLPPPPSLTAAPPVARIDSIR